MSIIVNCTVDNSTLPKHILPILNIYIYTYIDILNRIYFKFFKIHSTINNISPDLSRCDLNVSSNVLYSNQLYIMIIWLVIFFNTFFIFKLPPPLLFLSISPLSFSLFPVPLFFNRFLLLPAYFPSSLFCCPLCFAVSPSRLCLCPSSERNYERVVVISCRVTSGLFVIVISLYLSLSLSHLTLSLFPFSCDAIKRIDEDITSILKLDFWWWNFC